MDHEGDTCPFIMIKGDRKGLTCGAKLKSSSSKYCRAHLRNVGVQVELGNIPLSKSSDGFQSQARSLEGSYSQARPVDNKYTPTVVGSVLVKKKDAVKKNAFVTAFKSNITSKAESYEEDDGNLMENIYNDLEAADNVDDNDLEGDNVEPEVEYYKKELENAKAETLKAQRKINSMFTMKQLLFTGVKTVSDVGEKLGGETLKGYSSAVMTSDAINSLLDEMSDDLETIIGFTELPASVRLLATMGVIGADICVKNSTGVSTRSIDPRNTNPSYDPNINEQKKNVDDEKKNSDEQKRSVSFRPIRSDNDQT